MTKHQNDLAFSHGDLVCITCLLWKVLKITNHTDRWQLVGTTRYFRATRYFWAKVHLNLEQESPWALTLTGLVPEAFQFLPSDWPEKYLSQPRGFLTLQVNFPQNIVLPKIVVSCRLAAPGSQRINQPLPKYYVFCNAVYFYSFSHLYPPHQRHQHHQVTPHPVLPPHPA